MSVLETQPPRPIMQPGGSELPPLPPAPVDAVPRVIPLEPVPGLLQTVTFVTGIKALLLIVAGLYLVAVLTRPKGVSQPA